MADDERAEKIRACLLACARINALLALGVVDLPPPRREREVDLAATERAMANLSVVGINVLKVHELAGGPEGFVTAAEICLANRVMVRNEKLWAEARPDEGGMVTLIRRKQMFPSRTRRFCTEQLKLVPLKAHMSRLADDMPVVNAIGIRAAESQARSKLTEWEWNDNFDCWTWRPLITWSEQDVIDIHTRHGLAPNPLYLRGAERVGCYPCIYARKAEIAALPQSVVDRLSPLEHELTADAVARGVERPERAFFYLHDPANHASGFMPIERVREWARSDRGGRQMLLLDAPSEPGCMRWGLCEHLPADRQEVEP